jgi:uncharacterized membrane protein YeaQ/YmgE (transglycosylase-associated protein family)
MKKTITGGIVGGIILFVWGAIAWTVLPLHKPSTHSMANEDAVISALRASGGEKGMYFLPAMPEGAGPEHDAWMQKFKQGPLAMINYNPVGADPMMPGQFIAGLIINLIAGFLAAWFLSRSTAEGSSYLSRVIFCGMLGIFASFSSHLLAWNWLYFPLDYTTAMVADTVIGWLLAGLGIAAIVKTPKMATS